MGRLKGRDSVNVIFFETGVDAWRQKKMAPLTATNRRSLEKYIRVRKPRGGTNLWGGLERALASSGVDTIFLLSDGSPGSGTYTSTADILRETGRRNQTRRIAIHCVSIGTDSTLLKKLAAANGGKFSSELEIIREVRRINELKRITIHCVSLGRESSLLKRLASENGGRYVRR